MKVSAPSPKGYTLIEILVSLVIIGILFGVGFITFRDFSRRQVLTSVARQIKGDLKLAQEYALSGQKPMDDNTCVRLVGYRIKFSSTSYGVYRVCSGGEDPVEGKDNISITSGVTMVASPTSITFKVLGQGTDLENDLTIILTQEATGDTATINVSPSGKIE